MKEAIILAGGRGTRLRSVVSDVPKPMATVAGRPFLLFLLEYLIDNNISRVILSVGYKHEQIINYFGSRFKNLIIDYAIEEIPLGTGGAISHALTKINSSEVLILNGDTYSKVSVNKLYYYYTNYSPYIAVLIRPSEYKGRYDTIDIDRKYSIINSNNEQSYINSGMYIINRNWFLSEFNECKLFSFEEKLLRTSNNYKMIGVPDNNYFIDIGVPADYKKSSLELTKNKFSSIHDKQNTLFLDRDGVINKKIQNGYVTRWIDFIFLFNVKDVLKELAKRFNKVAVVTNQQCIGKELITYEQVVAINNKMLDELNIKKSQIDIFLCPHHIEDCCDCRKPETGLFKQAKSADNTIKFNHSIMIGDSASDIIAAKRLNIVNIYLTNGASPEILAATNCDYIYKNLYSFYNNYNKITN